MKINFRQSVYTSARLGVILYLLSLSFGAKAQIPPPGYEREMQLRDAQKNISPLDRDSITVTDTVVIFDPATYEESTSIIVSRYSLRNYCQNFYGMSNPDLLLDHNPHTIIDPKTYENITIRLNPSGKIDTIPK